MMTYVVTALRALNIREREREKINKLHTHALQKHFLLIAITHWLGCNLLQIKLYCCKANYITHKEKNVYVLFFLFPGIFAITK